MFTLVSNQGTRYTIDKRGIQHSDLLKSMVEMDSTVSEYVVHDAPDDVLHIIVRYMEYHIATPPKPTQRPLTSRLKDVVDDWDFDLMLELEFDESQMDKRRFMYNLFQVVWRIDMRSLIDLICMKFVEMMKHKTPDQIRSLFDIENDLTEQDMKHLKETTKFVFN